MSEKYDCELSLSSLIADAFTREPKLIKDKSVMKKELIKYNACLAELDEFHELFDKVFPKMRLLAHIKLAELKAAGRDEFDGILDD